MSIEKTVSQINDEISTLSTSVDKMAKTQANQIRRVRVLATIAISGFVIDITLTVLGFILLINTHTNADHIRQQQVSISNIQTRVSSDAFCPLYDLLLDSYDPTNPVAKADPAAYENTIRVIERGARALDCTHTTRGHN